MDSNECSKDKIDKTRDLTNNIDWNKPLISENNLKSIESSSRTR